MTGQKISKELEQLRNTYFGRLEIYYFLTKERRDIELFNGRFDDAKIIGHRRQVRQQLAHPQAALSLLGVLENRWLHEMRPSARHRRHWLER